MTKEIKCIIFIICCLVCILFATKESNTRGVDVVTETETATEAEAATEQETETEAPPPKSVEIIATAYCPCVKCCGKSDGITATGTKATAGRTIAVDPSAFPYGSEVIINGNTYIAEDCGGAIKGNRIDIYFDTHEAALQFGVQHLTAFYYE